MRVAVLTDRCDGHRDEFIAALARRGDEVMVYTPGGGPDTPVETIGDFARRLDRQWDAGRPDVVHAHNWRSGVAAQLAATAHGVPTVMTFDGFGPGSHEARPKLEKLVIRDAGWVTAPCTDELFELVRMGRARDSISVVPCGVDLQRFHPEGPTAPKGRPNRVVTVGKTLRRKGFDVVITALSAIADTELAIVGGPPPECLDNDPEVCRLRELAVRAGVADRVVFTGMVGGGEMPALLRSADVVACTAPYDARGVIGLEAMACGVPVVGPAAGGLVDAVVDEVTGRLVDARCWRGWAGAISAILRDAFYRRSLGLAGRDRACARYSWDRVAADTVRVYERLAGRMFNSTA